MWIILVSTSFVPCDAWSVLLSFIIVLFFFNLFVTSRILSLTLWTIKYFVPELIKSTNKQKNQNIQTSPRSVDIFVSSCPFIPLKEKLWIITTLSILCIHIYETLYIYILKNGVLYLHCYSDVESFFLLTFLICIIYIYIERERET